MKVDNIKESVKLQTQLYKDYKWHLFPVIMATIHNRFHIHADAVNLYVVLNKVAYNWFIPSTTNRRLYPIYQTLCGGYFSYLNKP